MKLPFQRCLAAAGVLLVTGCAAPAPPPAAPAPVTPVVTPVERGKYLVTANGCTDCHTPLKMGPAGPEPDMSRYLSGHPENVKVGSPPRFDATWMFAGNSTGTAWAGPWGISYTANITSDTNTGIGSWTEDMFLRAIREGKHMGQSRPILPPMPWLAFKNYSDEDLKAMFAYLKTVPPITNHVPEPVIAAPPPGK